MAETVVKALVSGGSATAGPPLGPALGPLGVNIGDIIKAINEKTKDFEGMEVPVKVIVDSATKEFRIEVGSPPVSALLKKELGIEKGSGKQGEEKAGNATFDQVVKVARMKQDSMLSIGLKGAVLEALGTCATLGITVDEKEPKDIQQAVKKGDFDAQIK